MKSRTILFILLGALGYWTFLYVYPYVVQKGFELKIGKERNSLIHSKLPSPTTPDTPNPDFIYTLIFYDLNNGNLRLTGKVPDELDYFSIAFYQSNTFFYQLLKPKDFKEDQFEIMLSDMYDSASSSNVINVVSPSKTGTIIFRYLCKRQTDINYISEMQRKSFLTLVRNDE
jgi:hypothetical protein